MKKVCTFKLIPLLIFCLLFTSCTGNPFGSDDIGSGTRQIRGQLQLNDNLNPKDSFVWLEAFNIGLRVDQSGEFELTLPPAASQGGQDGVSGIFELYFFMSNYRLSKSQLVIRNGEFVFSQGDLNGKGEFLKPVILSKSLDIATTVTPTVVAQGSSNPVDVEVRLEALLDPVWVTFPKTLGNANLLGGILIRNINSDQAFTVEAFPSIELKEEVIVVPNFPHIRTMQFTPLQKNLPVGDYEVIPYFLIKNDELPIELWASLGANLEEFSSSYLSIPMAREGGQFKISN